MRRYLIALALTITCCAPITGTRAAPAERSVSAVSHGVRISLKASTGPYIRDHFVDAAVSVKNVSHRTVMLYGYPATCWWNGAGGSNPEVVVRSSSGSVVFPPKPATTTHCPQPRAFPLPPGVTRMQMLYIPARGPWLQGSVKLVGKRPGHPITVSSPRMKITIE